MTPRPDAPTPWHVYVLRCADGSLYTGIALDVDARVAQHARGKGARYTRGRGPFQVCATASCATRGDALGVERAVKALRREAKLALVAEPGGLSALARALAAARARPIATRPGGAHTGRPSSCAPSRSSSR